MFDPGTYGTIFAALIDAERLNPLDAGSPQGAARTALGTLSAERAFAPRAIVDADMAQLCLAGLWLHQDFLDECHRISQSIGTTSGSHWHALMHRREGDFWNAKYWFRQVGRHSIYRSLAAEGARLAASGGPEQAPQFLLHQTGWDSAAFVDLCEATVQGRAPHDMLCRRIQQREWQLLFDHCYRHAVGA